MKQRMIGKMIYVKSKAPFYNAEELEVILVLKGRLKVYKIERSFEIKEGEFTFVNRNILHYFESEEGANILITTVNLKDFSMIFPYMEYVEFMKNDEVTQFKPLLASNLNTIVIDSLVKLYQMQNTVALKKERYFLEQQLMYMFFLNYQLISYLKQDSEYPTEELQLRYYQIVAYIIDNIHTKITTDDILNQVYMNAAYFSQFMKRIGGVNFKEFVAYRKLIFTCIYLSQSDLTMTEIASKVGITDMKTFYNIFKKHFNLSPAKFKETIKNKKDDYYEYQDMTILSEFCDKFRIHHHRDNTITKTLRYLTFCEEENIDLSHSTIYLNPYKDMGDQIDPDYQTYKNFESLMRLLKKMNIELNLGYPITYLKDEKQLSLTFAAILWHVSLFGVNDIKKWNISIEISDHDDLNFAKEIQKELYKRFGPLNVRIIFIR